MVVRARPVALAALARAEERVLDHVLVGLRLLRLVLHGLPEHRRQQVAALRHRAGLDVALPAVGILLEDRLVDVREVGQVVEHEVLRALEVALQHRDVRLERDGLAVVESLGLALPEQLLHVLAGPRQVVGALLRLLGIRRLRRQAQQQLHLLRRQDAPRVLVQRTRQQAVVHLRGLVELALVHAHLRPLEAAVHVEVDKVRAWLRHGGEELVVYLAALGHHAARVVGVRHCEAQRPVFAALLVLDAVDDLLHVLELSETEVALKLKHLQLGADLRPLLLGGGDDRLRDVRHARVDERVYEAKLLLGRGVGGIGLGCAIGARTEKSGARERGRRCHGQGISVANSHAAIIQRDPHRAQAENCGTILASYEQED